MTATRAVCLKFIKLTGFRFLKSWTLQPSLLLRQVNILSANFNSGEANKSNVTLWEDLSSQWWSPVPLKSNNPLSSPKSCQRQQKAQTNTEVQREINCDTLRSGATEVLLTWKKPHKETSNWSEFQRSRKLPLMSQTRDCFHVSKIMAST